MKKSLLSQILISGTELSATKLDKNDQRVIKFIKNTKKKQEEVLKLKNIDQESLQMVVQL
ncbi:MAG: hypothetical protein AB2L20_09630 [Mangrovibacterium sp.]